MMRQTTVCDFLAQPRSKHGVDTPTPTDAPSLEVWDLFCGAGGFSCGATMAGCTVVFGCDDNALALETHQTNHPHAQHVLTTLPCDEIPFPEDDRRWHLHGSPPCQELSLACQRKPGFANRSGGLALVRWYMAVAVSSRATSWSMEQVATLEVLRLLDQFRQAHPKRVAYAIFEFQDLGVPQSRKRVIAGTPTLIARLCRRAGAHRRRSVRDVLASPRGTHIRNPTTCVKKYRRFTRRPGMPVSYQRVPSGLFDNSMPTDGPAPTITTTGQFYWLQRGTQQKLLLQPDEMKALQTFPASYQFPSGKTHACRQIGNAVPPIVAQLLLSDVDPAVQERRMPSSTSL